MFQFQLLKLLKRGEIKKDERVVVVSTAHGLKFADQKALYHQNAIAGVTGTHSNEPIELPNDVELVRETLRRVIGEQQDHPSAGAER